MDKEQGEVTVVATCADCSWRIEVEFTGSLGDAECEATEALKTHRETHRAPVVVSLTAGEYRTVLSGLAWMERMESETGSEKAADLRARLENLHGHDG